VWTAPDGSGTVATPTPTDSLGVARTTWRLGSLTDQSAYASVAGVAELRFVAQAATQLSWRCDECRVLEAGSRVRIGVAPQYGSAGGPPAAVAFEAAPGSGTVTPAVSTSEAGGSTTGSGVAWVEWTLGDAPGPQKLTARLGGLQVEYVIDALPWLVPVAQVPGTVLDATSDRVLWASPGQLRIRTVATGADVTVPSGFPDGGAALFDGGALLWNRTGRLIVEYRNGEVAGLGTYAAASPPSVEGNWAAWGVEMNPGSYGADFIIRRDLVSGTSLFLPDPGAPGAGGRSIGRGPDVGPRGEVAFIEGHLVPWGFSWMHVRLYREGSFGGFGFTNVRDVQTDGINVATSTLDPGFHHIEPSTVLCLHTSLGVTCPTKGEWNVGFAYLLAGGWFAYFKGEERAVFRRSPAGVTEPMPHCWSIEALAPDGTLVCGYDHRYRLIPPGGTGYSAGRWNGEDRVVWRGDRFLVLRDGGVYTLGPAPAATSR
ncbi:MAG TPA: hypothetical protein VFR81_30700, partial [Longimicrobium sp.]|nr:hypothetical protein [Longimicrobium sp.]